MSKRRVHYVLSSHWDREWHHAFQDFRYHLVKMFDEIIDGVTQNQLQGPFVSDGQSIVLEDYLEVQPQKRPIVEKLLQEKKLIAGPWYVLPDEFLVSGESLIRNLSIGRQVVRDFGAKPSDAGFVCDLFGHNSQMPQIFSGFGIKMAFVWRGINCAEPAHFIWQSPDGTGVIAYRFGRFGYSDIATGVRGAAEHYGQPDADEIQRMLIETTKKEAQRSRVSAILRFDGQDHNHWDKIFYQVLLSNIKGGNDLFEFVHSSLDDYIKDVIIESDKINDVVRGELREIAFSNVDKDSHSLIHGTGSSRIVNKQQNHKCETLLCYWAEPWSAFAEFAMGQRFKNGFLETAWKWLLKNHPHDSICGCSIDDVHKDMEFRFRQSAQIADRLTTESIETIAENIDRIHLSRDKKYLRVVVFNPLPSDLKGISEITLNIPADWPLATELFGYEELPAFRIYNADGVEIKYQKISQHMNRPRLVVFDTKHPLAKKVHEVKVCLPLEIGAMGYSVLKVLPSEQVKGGWEGIVTAPVRHNQLPAMAADEVSMENEYLRVKINPNGSYDIMDKVAGNVYANLGIIEDAADIGDGWYHSPAANDGIFTSSGCSSEIALIHNGSMQSTFRVIQHMMVPDEFDFFRRFRSEKRTDVIIESFLTLRKDVDYLEVETTIYNRAKDHRMRVLFASGAGADIYLSDGPFDAVERRIGLIENYHLYRELDVEVNPQQNWTAVFDGDRGLAIIAPGQYESAVRDNSSRQIALTLFRSFRKTFLTAGEEDCQLLRALKFRYIVKPLKGPPKRTALFLLAQKLACEIKTVQQTNQELEFKPAPKKYLPVKNCFIRLDGNAVVSSVRKVTDKKIEIRIFNPEIAEEAVKIYFSDHLLREKFKQAFFVDFESKKIASALPVKDGFLDILLKSKEIKTISFEFGM